MKTKRKYKITAYGYDIFYRYATNPIKARNRIVYLIYGKRYEGYEHEYWKIEEVQEVTK